MSGFIAEFFGYPSGNRPVAAVNAAGKKACPFLCGPCTKILARDGTASGVCAIRQVSDPTRVICCPNRIYADHFKMIGTISEKAFGMKLPAFAGRAAVEKARELGGAVAVFGHGWGGELRLPQRKGTGSYFVDWVLARLGGTGELIEFTAIEVQTVDTTGSYRDARKALLEDGKVVQDTVGLNWENVSKRIIPQLIYKGQVLQREELCRAGLFFVCPAPVFARVLARLGGKDNLPRFPSQPAAIHFVSYDYLASEDPKSKTIPALGVIEEFCTTVYKVQEAFSAVDLPEANVYQKAIERSLYGK